MLKINNKNEILRRNLTKRHYLNSVVQVLHLTLSKHLNRTLSKFLRNLHPQLFVQNPRTKVRSICLLTGRSRSVYRSFKMSRLKLREYASQGYFTGIAKAS